MVSMESIGDLDNTSFSKIVRTEVSQKQVQEIMEENLI